MKSVQKWDFNKREYKTVEISDKCSAYEIDMETKVECPGCGKIIAYGDGYTSRQYHTNLGFGYCVCAKCYGKELKEEFNYIKECENEKIRN